MQDTRTAAPVLPMLTNKWIHLLPGEFSSLGPPTMCPCLDVHSPVWIYIGLLCMIFVLTKRFTENYGRQECLNACLCRQMKMNTVLKCICLIQLKPWKDADSAQGAPALQRDWSHKDEFTIIPVLVGALSESKEQEFGKLFSKYLADPSNLFVVSSDFCHWESVLWNGFTNELPSFPQRVRFLLYRIFFPWVIFSSHLLNLKRTEGRHLKKPLTYSLGSSRACPAPRAVSMALKARKLILDVETGAQRIHFPSVPSERISFRSKVPLQLL
ncbi:protein MEMO1 isoform X3 [Microtus ochrogaster]|uniref:Protein MEMO1 n=1 Tax=Microtus ochrogaster TaxID=79684 RepID=A0ABM1UU05_MICOH|nr:protein MEMO1 isoform X3 [Microtus ochrogaster]